jgi:hypothetical protein
MGVNTVLPSVKQATSRLVGFIFATLASSHPNKSSCALVPNPYLRSMDHGTWPDLTRVIAGTPSSCRAVPEPANRIFTT